MTADFTSWAAACVWPIDLMKFILRYDGPLHAEQDSREDRLRRAKEKWDIRRQLHPQLTELWATSAALERARQYAIIPKEGGYMRWEEHHSARIIGPIIPANHRYLFEPVLCRLEVQSSRTRINGAHLSLGRSIFAKGDARRSY
jgi:hypothetical protein